MTGSRSALRGSFLGIVDEEDPLEDMVQGNAMHTLPTAATASAKAVAGKLGVDEVRERATSCSTLSGMSRSTNSIWHYDMELPRQTALQQIPDPASIKIKSSLVGSHREGSSPEESSGHATQELIGLLFEMMVQPKESSFMRKGKLEDTGTQIASSSMKQDVHSERAPMTFTVTSHGSLKPSSDRRQEAARRLFQHHGPAAPVLPMPSMLIEESS